MRNIALLLGVFMYIHWNKNSNVMCMFKRRVSAVAIYRHKFVVHRTANSAYRIYTQIHVTFSTYVDIFVQWSDFM